MFSYEDPAIKQARKDAFAGEMRGIPAWFCAKAMSQAHPGHIYEGCNKALLARLYSESRVLQEVGLPKLAEAARKLANKEV